MPILHKSSFQALSITITLCGIYPFPLPAPDRNLTKAGVINPRLSLFFFSADWLILKDEAQT